MVSLSICNSGVAMSVYLSAQKYKKQMRHPLSFIEVIDSIEDQGGIKINEIIYPDNRGFSL